MPVAKPSTSAGRFITFLSLILVVAVLRLAEDVMIPIALAFLLAFLLTPLVVRLTRWRFPKPVAIITTVTLAFAVMAAIGWQVTHQAVALVGELPSYETNLRQKISVLKQPQASNSLSRAMDSLEKMWGDIQEAAPEPEPKTKTGAAPPVPVEVKASERTSFEMGRDLLGRLFKPLGTAGIVIVFVVVILFQREDLRNRLIRLISGGQLNIATEAVDDAAQRVSRYLLAQLMVNTCYGIAIGLGLWIIGIPHAPLWGTLATLLRFIPFLGPLIAACFPLLLSIAVDPGWSMLFWTAGLIIAAELVTNNVIEVLVYGTSTGISTLALLIAAVFWSWLWGMPGLFLSMPLTVCLLVIGQYVPGLKFLSVLLGSEPALQPSAQFYQTMLSMKQEDMFDLATDYVEHHSLTAFYDEVFVPALLMSEVDRHNGVLAEIRQKFILESGRELIEELSERTESGRAPETEPHLGPTLPSLTGSAPMIVGVPARDEADELVALMLAHLLRENGIAANVMPAAAHLETFQDQFKPERVTVFVSALPPSTLSGAGRVCRKVKQLNPSAKVLVGVWSSEAKIDPLRRRLDPAGVDGIVTRLSEAIVQVKKLLHLSSEPNVPAQETESTRTLERTELTLASTKPEEATDTVTREVARAFNVPISLVTVIQSDAGFWHQTAGSTGTPFPEASPYSAVLASDELLVVEDVGKEDRFSENPVLLKRGVRFFATAPLRVRSGHLVGNLCILDTQPRTFSDADRELLQSLAAQLIDTLEPETATPSPKTPALSD